MPSVVASYANDGITVCQSRTYSCYIKIEWWRPQPPPLLHIFRPACRRRGRRSSHPSQRDFLHRAAHLDDIDTVRQAADAAVRCRVYTLSGVLVAEYEATGATAEAQAASHVSQSGTYVLRVESDSAAQTIKVNINLR